jgi:hypothetical protein
MASEDSLPLRVLCSGYDGPDTVELYALYPKSHGDVAEGALNRLNGMPVGVTDERWPVDEDGRRYAHVCTLDLATMPALAAAEPGIRAAALFVCDPARDRGGDDLFFVHRWVMLREEEAARGIVATRGLPAWGPEDHEPARPFRVEAHRLPRAVFQARKDEEQRITEIRLALLGLHGRAGGGATHVGKDPWWPADPFFLQIDTVFGGISVDEPRFLYVDRTSMRAYPELEL